MVSQHLSEGIHRISPLERDIDQYLIHLRVEKGSSENTIASYSRDLRRYVEFMASRGIIDAHRIRTADVRAFMRELAQPTLPRAEESGDSGHPSKRQGEKPSESDTRAEELEDTLESLAVSLYTSDQTKAPSTSTRDVTLPLPLGPNSIARTMAAVRGAHSFWHASRILETDPAAVVKPPKNVKRLPKAVSVEQMQKLLATPSLKNPTGLRNRAILEFLYATGARVSEMLATDLDDIHLGEKPRDENGESIALPGYVRLFGKGGKERLVPLGSYAQRALEDYIVRARPKFASHGKGTAALFLNGRGSRLGRQGAWLILKEAAEEAGLSSDFSPHSIRHSFATHLVQGGADIRVVQELLGHASIATTQVYTKVTPEGMLEVYRMAHPRAHERT